MTCSLCISGSQFNLVYKTVTVVVWQWSRQPSTIITFMKTVKKNCACLRCQHSVWVFFFSKCQTVLSPHYFTTAGQKRRRKKVRTSHYPSEDLNYRAGFWVSNLDFFCCHIKFGRWGDNQKWPPFCHCCRFTASRESLEPYKEIKGKDFQFLFIDIIEWNLKLLTGCLHIRVLGNDPKFARV